jgi:hypothetical protein
LYATTGCISYLIDGIIVYWLQALPSARLECFQSEICGRIVDYDNKLGDSDISGRIAVVQQNVFEQEIPDANLAK